MEVLMIPVLLVLVISQQLPPLFSPFETPNPPTRYSVVDV